MVLMEVLHLPTAKGRACVPGPMVGGLSSAGCAVGGCVCRQDGAGQGLAGRGGKGGWVAAAMGKVVGKAAQVGGEAGWLVAVLREVGSKGSCSSGLCTAHILSKTAIKRTRIAALMFYLLRHA